MEKQYLSHVIKLLFLGIGTIYDVKTKTLPRNFFVLFGILGMFTLFFQGEIRWQRKLAGAGIGAVFLLLGWLTKESVGYGDGLGILVLSIFEEGSTLIMSVFYALLFSAAYGSFRLLVCRGRKQDTLPFFPFLLLGTMGVKIL